MLILYPTLALLTLEFQSIWFSVDVNSVNFIETGYGYWRYKADVKSNFGGAWEFVCLPCIVYYSFLSFTLTHEGIVNCQHNAFLAVVCQLYKKMDEFRENISSNT